MSRSTTSRASCALPQTSAPGPGLPGPKPRRVPSRLVLEARARRARASVQRRLEAAGYYSVVVPMIKQQGVKLRRSRPEFPGKGPARYSLEEALDVLRIFSTRWREGGWVPDREFLPLLEAYDREEEPRRLLTAVTLWELEPWPLRTQRPSRDDPSTTPGEDSENE